VGCPSPYLGLPHMLTGTGGGQFSTARFLADVFVGSLVMAGIWFILLGRWIWSGGPGVNSKLLATHGSVMIIGAVLVIYGIYALRAAIYSAKTGGGLLSGFGLLPLSMGLLAIGVALTAIIIARRSF